MLSNIGVTENLTSALVALTTLDSLLPYYLHDMPLHDFGGVEPPLSGRAVTRIFPANVLRGDRKVVFLRTLTGGFSIAQLMADFVMKGDTVPPWTHDFVVPYALNVRGLEPHEKTWLKPPRGTFAKDVSLAWTLDQNDKQGAVLLRDTSRFQKVTLEQLTRDKFFLESTGEAFDQLVTAVERRLVRFNITFPAEPFRRFNEQLARYVSENSNIRVVEGKIDELLEKPIFK